MSLGSVVKGVVGGGAVGGIPGMQLGGLLGLLNGGMGGYDTVSQTPFRTPEQLAMQKMLMDYAQTGKFGDITAGENLNLPLGVYTPTDIEQAGLGKLRTMMSSTESPDINMARLALGDLLSTSDANINKQFEPFQTSTLRSIRESEDALKRASAFGGNLYSTNTIRRLGDIGARGNEVMAQKLADLTNQALDRRLQAIPLATSLARTEEDINMGRVGASQTYGSLERLLESANQEAKRQEILRQRQEKLSRINTANSLAGMNAEWGLPSVTTYQPSPFENLLNIAASVGGKVLGAKAGVG